MVYEHLLGDRNASVIGVSNLNVIWVLGFEIWDFRFGFRKVDLFLSESTIVYFDITRQLPHTALDTGNAGV